MGADRDRIVWPRRSVIDYLLTYAAVALYEVSATLLPTPRSGHLTFAITVQLKMYCLLPLFENQAPCPITHPLYSRR